MTVVLAAVALVAIAGLALAGRHLALLMASTMLGALVRDGRWAQRGGLRLDPRRPLPATFNNFALRFARDGVRSRV